jgi:selenocysteine lyase/cysteine desulfurase
VTGSRSPIDFQSEHDRPRAVFESRARWSLRVSVQGYNDAADLEALVAALGGALSES